MIKNVSFTEADITGPATEVNGWYVINIKLTAAHGIVSGHDVYLKIMTPSTTGTISLSTYSNTVIQGGDADKYKLGTGCTINLGTL